MSRKANEVIIRLTGRQAYWVLLEMQRIVNDSDDAWYRRLAKDACTRIQRGIDEASAADPKAKGKK